MNDSTPHCLTFKLVIFGIHRFIPTFYNFEGDYWIDPNEGDIRDAILVFCDIQSRMTCIRPQPVRSQILDIITEESETWIGDHNPGFKVRPQS